MIVIRWGTIERHSVCGFSPRGTKPCIALYELQLVPRIKRGGAALRDQWLMHRDISGRKVPAPWTPDEPGEAQRRRQGVTDRVAPPYACYAKTGAERQQQRGRQLKEPHHRQRESHGHTRAACSAKRAVQYLGQCK